MPPRSSLPLPHSDMGSERPTFPRVPQTHRGAPGLWGPLADDSSVPYPPWSHPCLGPLSPGPTAQTKPVYRHRAACSQPTLIAFLCFRVQPNTAVSRGWGACVPRAGPPPRGWQDGLARTANGRRVLLCWGQPVFVFGALWGPSLPLPPHPSRAQAEIQESDVRGDRTPAADRLPVAVCLGLGLAWAGFRNVPK